VDDRYPLNQANCAFINITAWAFYLVPVILPGAVWLGIAQVLFGMVGQLIVHGVVINIRLKTIYNPGLAAVVLGHVPLWHLVPGRGQRPGSRQRMGLALRCADARRVRRRNHAQARVWPHERQEHAIPVEPRETARWNRIQHLTRAGITPLPLGTGSS